MPDSKDEVFAFGRTLSRLLEMRSHEYLVRSTRLHEAAANAFMLIDRQGVLTHAEAGELFKAYDVDASGYLERPEMRLLMEDLSERRKGHRNVLDEEVDALFGMMDVDDNGYVSIHEFCEVFADSDLGSVVVSESAEGASKDIEPLGGTPPRGLARASRVSRAG